MGCGNTKEGSKKLVQKADLVMKVSHHKVSALCEIPNWKSVKLENVIQKQNRWELIHLAAFVDNVYLVEELVQNGVNPNKTDCKIKIGHNDTPLHLAAFQGNFSTVQFLVNFGANSNVFNSVRLRQRKETPLQIAMERGFYEIAKVFTEKQENGEQVFHAVEVDGRKKSRGSHMQQVSARVLPGIDQMQLVMIKIKIEY